jgi:hypothetical protein
MSRRGELLVELVGECQDRLSVQQPFDQVRQADAGAVESADLGGPLKERILTLEASWPEARYLTTGTRLKGAKKAGAVLKAKADEAYTDLYTVARQLRRDGKTLAEIAVILNGEGYTTSRGLPWGKVQVAPLLERADRLA